jgi:hypothetical protein
MGTPKVRSIVAVIEPAIPVSSVGGPVVVVALLVQVVPHLVFVPMSIHAGSLRIPCFALVIPLGIALIALRVALRPLLVPLFIACVVLRIALIVLLIALGVLRIALIVLFVALGVVARRRYMILTGLRRTRR